jgi:competence CoiA-like predicted nuclease
MLFATVNGERVEATPNTKGKCPLCEKTVLAKCGEINIWHWAHTKDENCDNWYEPKTEWHKNWKLTFGKDNCEKVISKDGVRHIADIHTIDNFIIELQNSPIQKQIIIKRENFYGERMMWIINGKPFKDNFSYRRTRSVRLDEEEEYYLKYNPLLANKNIQPRKDEYTFRWNWSKKSWSSAQRKVFIDFGDEHLFWVLEGIGTSGGIGKLISKERFIKEHSGNIDFLEILIDKNDI